MRIHHRETRYLTGRGLRRAPTGGHPVSRRRVLLAAGASVLAAPAILRSGRSEAGPASSLFTLGVASGDPRAHSVVLWTRLAPDPLNGGGLPAAPVTVLWEVASDETMRSVIAGGTVEARPENGHAVHVTATRLPSDSWLYYRFTALGEKSRVGRTRTFPRPDQAAAGMRFAVVSCQHYEQGAYPAWRDIAHWRFRRGEDLDFVVHTGDYIYEYGGTPTPVIPGRVHVGGECFSVEDYRNRYAQYRLDPHLQQAHAHYPFIVTPDDHEVENNYAGLVPEEGGTPPADFPQRRRNAYQVYAESMPLRAANRVVGTSGRLQLFRRLGFGDLADIHVLDTRQFRSDQPAGDGFGSTDPDSLVLEGVFGETMYDAAGILDPAAQLLGAPQEAWLADGLRRSRARWNILAQQVMVTKWNLIEAARLSIAGNPALSDPLKAQLLALAAQVDNLLNVDAWDGYQSARRRLFDVLASVRPNNPVVVTGDIHSAWAANLLDDFSAPDSDMLAAEFVCTSISSTFLAIDPRPTHAIVKASVRADNPHIPYFNGLFRGYCLCEVDRDLWKTTYRAVGGPAQVADPSPLALVPQESSRVETDAVVTLRAGFNAPGSGERLRTRFARSFPAPL